MRADGDGPKLNLAVERTRRALLRCTTNIARTAQLRSKGQLGFENRLSQAIHVS